MRTCSHCGHVLWLTAGARACGSCDLMGWWPRINGSDVGPWIDEGPYDWESDSGYFGASDGS